MCAGAAEQGLSQEVCHTELTPGGKSMECIFVILCINIFLQTSKLASFESPVSHKVTFSVPVSVQSHFSFKWSHLFPHQGACFSHTLVSFLSF